MWGHRGYTIKRYHRATPHAGGPMRGAESRDALSRVGSGIRAPKLLNLKANLALAGVNGSGKSNGVTGLVGSPPINPGCRDPQRPTEAGSVCARRRCHPAWRRCAAVRADRGARSRKQQPAHHQRRYQSPCSDPCTRFNSAALELAVARGGGCAGGAKRPIPDRRSARRTA